MAEEILYDPEPPPGQHEVWKCKVCKVNLPPGLPFLKAMDYHNDYFASYCYYTESQLSGQQKTQGSASASASFGAKGAKIGGSGTYNILVGDKLVKCFNIKGRPYCVECLRKTDPDTYKAIMLEIGGKAVPYSV